MTFASFSGIICTLNRDTGDVVMKVAGTYARLSQYGDLLIPLSLLDKVVSEGFIVRTSYEDGVDQLSEITRIKDVKIHEGDEVSTVLMHSALSEPSR